MSQEFLNLYNQEMYRLQQLMEEYAEKHPNLRPMISGRAADPDIARLMQSVALQNALLRRKLDDDYPEITQNIVGKTSYYLRPIPAITTVSFTPKESMTQSEFIPKGTFLTSRPVDGKSFQFQTCYDVEIHPLSLIDACFDDPDGKPAQIRLTLELRSLSLDKWQAKKLRFFLSGGYPEAADLRYLLLQHLDRIKIRPREGGKVCDLEGRYLQDAGFESRVIPFHPGDFPSVSALQEYFFSPEKFLYVDLTGLELWRNRGEGSKFEICFELKPLTGPPPRVSKKDFALFSTPVVNIFECQAATLDSEKLKEWNPIRPTDMDSHVYSVENVVGLKKGEKNDINYLSLDTTFSPATSDSVYKLKYEIPPLKNDTETFINLNCPDLESKAAVGQTINISLKCTNGKLPAALKVGDTWQYLDESPQFATFTNIKPVTPGFPPPIEKNALWHAISHRQFNRSLLQDRNLCVALKFYAFAPSRDYQTAKAHERRVDGIQTIKPKRGISVYGGEVTRGLDVEILIRRDHFSSHGDMYLFGCVLDYFLPAFVTENSFTRLTMKEDTTGREYKWRARRGYRRIY